MCAQHLPNITPNEYLSDTKVYFIEVNDMFPA